MELPLNPKWGFSAYLGGEVMSFGPFEAAVTAEQVRGQMKKEGVDVGEVMPLHTCTTARGIVSALKAGWKPQRSPMIVDDMNRPVVEESRPYSVEQSRPMWQAVEESKPQRTIRGRIMRAIGGGDGS